MVLLPEQSLVLEQAGELWLFLHTPFMQPFGFDAPAIAAVVSISSKISVSIIAITSFLN
jgi:hypothetical protein